MTDDNQSIDGQLEKFYEMNLPQRLINYATYARQYGIIEFFTQKPYMQDPSSFIQKTFQTFYGQKETEDGFETYFAKEEEITGYFDRIYKQSKVNKKTHDILLHAYVNILSTGGPVPAIIKKYNEDYGIKTDYAIATKFVNLFSKKATPPNSLLDDILTDNKIPKMRKEARKSEDNIIKFNKYA